MEIVLVRHAEPEWVKSGLNVDDPPLTERGHEQARFLARRLAGEHFDEVYVSPLLRARQTAMPYLQEVDRELVVAPWLEEIRNPVWHGTPVEKAEEAYAADRARPAVERWHGLPGGEAPRDFVVRIRSGASAFLGERGIEAVPGELPVWRISGPSRRILCVAHAGTNSVTVCFLLGLQPTPWEWDRFQIGHATITRLEAIALGDGHTFGLSVLSDGEHLPRELRTR